MFVAILLTIVTLLAIVASPLIAAVYIAACVKLGSGGYVKTAFFWGLALVAFHVAFLAFLIWSAVVNWITVFA